MIKTYQIEKETAGQRLDHFMQKNNPDLTRSHIQVHIKEGLIRVNNEKVKSGYVIKLGDQITFEAIETKPLDIEAVDLKLDIVYEDEDIIVINKPKGLVVHPASSYKEPTLVHGLLHQASHLSGINGIARPGIVHRIDKDTSGLLLVAKNDQSHQILAAQFAKHEVKRQYIALVYGTFTTDKATIDAPIQRHKQNRLKMTVSKDGKRAITHVEVLKRFETYTLVNCSLETGRTHQIRVHMAYINHPIVGDPIYGPKKVVGKTGQFLHAHTLSFLHPTKKEHMTFTVDMPNDFKVLLDELNG